ncbi:TPA: hypothetical protein ACHTH4_004774 [Escherichia coli]
MKHYPIQDFSLPCPCGGIVTFCVIVGEDQNNKINDMGYLAGCDTCNSSSGLTNDIAEAYEEIKNDLRRYSNDTSLDVSLIHSTFRNPPCRVEVDRTGNDKSEK